MAFSYAFFGGTGLAAFLRFRMKSRCFGTGISRPLSVVCTGWPLRMRSFGLRPI